MKVVILCGGKGTRMKEETEYRPKPLVDIAGKPIIWHIMKIYSYYGINDFILCLGYKGEMIKQYFNEMSWRNNDYTIHIKNGMSYKRYHTNENINWNITMVDTGLETLTAGRLKKIKKYLDEDEFLMTYGDGLSDINITEAIKYHRQKGKIATITGVRPKSSFGIIEVENGIAKSFTEKPKLDGIINGGFMVLNKKIFDYIPEQDCMFVQEPLRNIAKDGELAVYKHGGFWIAIDTFKDIQVVNELWNSGKKTWKIWE
ncbi:glucose-1-phosphate cytidylyltransferase [Oceanirhabdus sp. W0125-5]|uniref:glucose-1-phosphate cytidylyltransferase n=1 Tax=Oceanirhabdus sp. W0125-5 TaxID=2999116 RepID=UPI0022F34112|nr:glucose-1-phosphate cytidylyltransferase [Oceanirhabdus sp. W0125-5]WBW96651.1 glucose-1-phosphate cytidylyltransferase [Oceanirhabdus sp. W0125-5]